MKFLTLILFSVLITATISIVQLENSFAYEIPINNDEKRQVLHEYNSSILEFIEDMSATIAKLQQLTPTTPEEPANLSPELEETKQNFEDKSNQLQKIDEDLQQRLFQYEPSIRGDLEHAKRIIEQVISEDQKNNLPMIYDVGFDLEQPAVIVGFDQSIQDDTDTVRQYKDVISEEVPESVGIMYYFGNPDDPLDSLEIDIPNMIGQTIIGNCFGQMDSKRHEIQSKIRSQEFVNKIANHETFRKLVGDNTYEQMGFTSTGKYVNEDDDSNCGYKDASFTMMFLVKSNDDKEEKMLDVYLDPITLEPIDFVLRDKNTPGNIPLNGLPAPYKQFEHTKDAKEIFCNIHLQLEICLDGRPVCLKESTAKIFIERGLVIADNTAYNQNIIDKKDDGVPDKNSNIIAVTADNTIDANNQFAFNFYSQISQDEKTKDQNIFFSPLSIFAAFAIAYEGAVQNTATQMQQTFGFESDDKKRHTEISDMMSGLDHKEDWYKLNVANALWIKENYTIKQDYLDAAKSHYSSTIENVNFATDDSINTINDWVKEKTNNKIQDILAPGSTDEYTR